MSYAPLLPLVALLPSLARRWRHILCRRGHRGWDAAQLLCRTCCRTDEEIQRGYGY